MTGEKSREQTKFSKIAILPSVFADKTSARQMNIIQPIQLSGRLKKVDAAVSPQDIIYSQGSDSANYSPELNSPGTVKCENENPNFRLIPWSMQQALDDPK